MNGLYSAGEDKHTKANAPLLALSFCQLKISMQFFSHRVLRTNTCFKLESDPTQFVLVSIHYCTSVTDQNAFRSGNTLQQRWKQQSRSSARARTPCSSKVHRAVPLDGRKTWPQQRYSWIRIRFFFIQAMKRLRSWSSNRYKQYLRIHLQKEARRLMSYSVHVEQTLWSLIFTLSPFTPWSAAATLKDRPITFYMCESAKC